MSVHHASLASLGLALACSCGGSAPGSIVPPQLVIPVPPADRPPPPAPSGAAVSTGFASLSDRVLGELLADEPSTARDLGLHEYDGKVAPMSREAIAARVALLRQAAQDLSAIDEKSLSAEEALDRAELENWVSTRIFWLVDADAPRRYPQAYEGLFSVNVYVERDYAPLEERARRLVAQEEEALQEVGHVTENLATPLSKPVAEVASRNYAGFATYLRHDVAKLMGTQGDEAQRRRFASANESLAKAADNLAAWLAKESARGDQSHVLGRERYIKLLRAQEGLTVPLEEFERMNEENLAANKAAYEALAGSAKPKAVAEATLFATAGRMMRDARSFIVDRGIVTLASDDTATLRETPPYQRWNSASIEMSGPFESARSAFFQLTIPDRSWPAKQRQAYLGTLGDLLGTTIHEVYPGHFVQLRWAEHAPTRVQKAFASYSFIEGWAHYTEQMMIERGFGSEDPANRLAMLRGALLRNCRFSASVGIHTQGMTVERAERRFVTDCHQDPPMAHEQALRGTFDPGYFAYTLGKLQIMALRDEVKARLGDRFSLQRFHDALLAHGSPPVALIHDRVIGVLDAP